MSSPFGERALHARGAVRRPLAEGHRADDPRLRQGDDRRGLSSDDGLFPAGRPRRDADRADRIGIEGEPRPLHHDAARPRALRASRRSRAVSGRAGPRAAPATRRNPRGAPADIALDRPRRRENGAVAGRRASLSCRRNCPEKFPRAGASCSRRSARRTMPKNWSVARPSAFWRSSPPARPPSLRPRRRRAADAAPATPPPAAAAAGSGDAPPPPRLRRPPSARPPGATPAQPPAASARRRPDRKPRSRRSGAEGSLDRPDASITARPAAYIEGKADWTRVSARLTGSLGLVKPNSTNRA